MLIIYQKELQNIRRWFTYLNSILVCHFFLFILCFRCGPNLTKFNLLFDTLQKRFQFTSKLNKGLRLSGQNQPNHTQHRDSLCATSIDTKRDDSANLTQRETRYTGKLFCLRLYATQLVAKWLNTTVSECIILFMCGKLIFDTGLVPKVISAVEQKLRTSLIGICRIVINYVANDIWIGYALFNLPTVVRFQLPTLLRIVYHSAIM